MKQRLVEALDKDHCALDLWQVQTVAHTTYCFQQFRPGWIVLNRLPEPTHMHIQRAGVTCIFRVPDLPDQGFPHHQPARVVHKDLKQSG